MSERTEMQEAVADLKRALSMGVDYRRDYSATWNHLAVKAARRNALEYRRMHQKEVKK